MTIANGSFEIAGTSPDEAYEWVITSGSTSSFTPFDTTLEPWDTMAWGVYLVELDPSTSLWLFFDGNTNLYEEFSWGNTFIPEWDSGWTTSFTDAFDWSVFNDTWVSGTIVPPDTFDWSVFNDIWVPGTKCLFTSGTLDYEDFEGGW